MGKRKGAADSKQRKSCKEADQQRVKAKKKERQKQLEEENKKRWDAFFQPLLQKAKSDDKKNDNAGSAEEPAHERDNGTNDVSNSNSNCGENDATSASDTGDKGDDIETTLLNKLNINADFDDDVGEECSTEEEEAVDIDDSTYSQQTDSDDDVSWRPIWRPFRVISEKNTKGMRRQMASPGWLRW